jgi:hypothetical protein
MNHEKHVIPEKVSASVNILPKIFGRKNKIKYNNSFCLNLLVVLVWSNMSDTFGYLHWTPAQSLSRMTLQIFSNDVR